MRRVLIGVIVISVLALVGILFFRDWLAPSGAVGTSPTLSLPNLHGEVVSMEDFRGKPVIVAFAGPQLGAHQAIRIANVYVRERHPELQIVTVGTTWATAGEVPDGYRSLGHDVLLGTSEDRSRWSDDPNPALFFVDADGIVQNEWVGIIYPSVMRRLGDDLR